LAPETSREVLQEMPREEAQEVRELLQFAEDSAGGMMNTEFVFVGEAATREEVLDWVRTHDYNVEQLDTVFLTNPQMALSGAVPIARLLMAAPGAPLRELKAEPLVYVEPEAGEKEVFELFDKYNLRTLAVTDKEGHPIGSITVDDVVTRLRSRV
jgi:magnesium transporter